MFHLTDNPIDVLRLLGQVRSPRAGAVVLFLGTVRDSTEARRTASLQYEAYREMAEKELAELEAEALKRWPLVACAIEHRLGPLAVGEVSVAIAASAPHRQAAFEAGQWLIDSIKQVVPIWKQEIWETGDSDWVHPGVTS